MAPLDRPHTIYYQFAIVAIVAYLVSFSSYLTLTLTLRLQVIGGH